MAGTLTAGLVTFKGGIRELPLSAMAGLSEELSIIRD